jgi:hypothetical protein
VKKLTLITTLILLTVSRLAHAQVPGIINYQGRIVDNGTNFTGTGQFQFALVNGTLGTTNYWSNDGTPFGQPAAAVSLTVTKGLYSVLLGDTTIPNMTASIPAAVFTNSDVRLRVWFNDGVSSFQQLSPDQRIGSAGYAQMAAGVPAGAIGSAQLASNAVTAANLAPGSVTASAIASGAVGSSQLASNAINAANLVAPLAAQGVMTTNSFTTDAAVNQTIITNLLYATYQYNADNNCAGGANLTALVCSFNDGLSWSFIDSSQNILPTNYCIGSQVGGCCPAVLFYVDSAGSSNYLYSYQPPVGINSNYWCISYSSNLSVGTFGTTVIVSNCIWTGGTTSSLYYISAPYLFSQTNGGLYAIFCATNSSDYCWSMYIQQALDTNNIAPQQWTIPQAITDTNGQAVAGDDPQIIYSGGTNYLSFGYEGNNCFGNGQLGLYINTNGTGNLVSNWVPVVTGNVPNLTVGNAWPILFRDSLDLWHWFYNQGSGCTGTEGLAVPSGNNPATTSWTFVGSTSLINPLSPASSFKPRVANTTKEYSDVCAALERASIVNAQALAQATALAQPVYSGSSPTFNSLAVSNSVAISGAATISGNANIAQGGIANIAGVNFGYEYGSTFLPEITATSTVQEVALYTASNFGSGTYNGSYTNHALTSPLMSYGVVGLWLAGKIGGSALMNSDWGNEWILVRGAFSTNNPIYWSTNGLAGQWYTADGVATTGVVVASGTYTNQAGFVAPDFGGGISLFGGQVLWTPAGDMVIGGVTNQIVFNNSSPNFSNLIVLGGSSIPSNTAGFATNSCYGPISNYVVGSTVTNSCGQRALFWLDLFSAGDTPVPGTNALYVIHGDAGLTQLVELVVCSSAQTSIKLGPIPLNPGDAIMSSNLVDSSGNGANNCTNVTGAWLIGL